MCSIVISTDENEAKELVHLNKYRGTHSFSVTIIDENFRIVSQIKSLGELDEDLIKIGDDQLVIIHQQAPTTSGKTQEFIHPDIIDNNHLWHNGIIKDITCERIARSLVVDNAKLANWDTHLIHCQLVQTSNLNNIDGSFALAFLKEHNYLRVARNEIAPLYMSKNSLSSTKFKNSISIPPNIVYDLIMEDKSLYLIEEPEMKFETINNPYYFIE